MSHLLVVAGIFVRGGKLLLVRRPEGGACPGLWEFPGGKVEPGETPYAALVREWREELGVTVAGAVPFAFATGGEGTRPLVLLFYKVVAFAGDPRPLTASDLRWSPPGEASVLPMPAPDAPVMERLLGEGGESFVDTEAPEAPALVAKAMEADPYILGSEEITERRLIRFSKRTPDGDSLSGLLVDTPAGVKAWRNVCPHVPIPLDRRGEETELRDGRLVCQHHAAVFDAATGLCLAGPSEGHSLLAVPLVRSGFGWAIVQASKETLHE